MKRQALLFLTFATISTTLAEEQPRMEILYAPWRGSYTSDKNAPTKKEDATAQECNFCIQLSEKNDGKHFILRRFQHCMVMLARYPYSRGHLLILPLEHINKLETIPPDAQKEMLELLTASCAILTKVLQPDGINIGLNLGKAAGAGIPSHLHWHIVPRWTGDATFMQTIAHTNVYELNLEKLYKDLKEHFDKI